MNIFEVIIIVILSLIIKDFWDIFVGNRIISWLYKLLIYITKEEKTIKKEIEKNE